MCFYLQPAKKRSKTCILVKNLPAGTDPDEIKALFEKHGQLARFLMPNHGITALVDFIETFEAKKAFGKLAYSMFKSGPLYLEWAPENVFVKSSEKKQEIIKDTAAESNEKDIPKKTASGTKDKDTPKKTEKTKENKGVENKKEEKKHKVQEDEYIEEEQPENDTTLFVKNLNFKTTEDSLRAVSFHYVAIIQPLLLGKN